MKTLKLALILSLNAVTLAGHAKTEIVYDQTQVEAEAYLYEMPSMCYQGEMGEVPFVIEDMMNKGVLHGDQGIQAMRYGHSTMIRYESQFFGTNPEFRAELESDHAGLMKKWDKYNTKSKTVLIISDLGPQGDGTELYLTEIKPCN